MTRFAELVSKARAKEDHLAALDAIALKHQRKTDVVKLASPSHVANGRPGQGGGMKGVVFEDSPEACRREPPFRGNPPETCTLGGISPIYSGEEMALHDIASEIERLQVKIIPGKARWSERDREFPEQHAQF